MYSLIKLLFLIIYLEVIVTDVILSGFLIYSIQHKCNKNQDLTCKAGILRITSWTNSFLHSRENLL